MMSGNRIKFDENSGRRGYLCHFIVNDDLIYRNVELLYTRFSTI
jgi:hypothetical protein